VTALRAADLGVRFLLDRHGRSVSPTIASISPRSKRVWGIRRVNLDVASGEGVALIGPNGAGKTTLLRTLAGVYAADEGTLEIRGRIGRLLSLTGALLGTLSGSENAYAVQLMTNLSRSSARAGVSQVAVCSRLGPALDRQVGSYSSGMKARLAFCAMLRSEPEVVLVDEVLGTLDHQFRKVAEARLRTVLETGGIVIAAGHDHEKLARLCNRAVLLEQGSITADGAFNEVVEGYLDGKLARGDRSRPA
jgi:ABC-type polysaccharide/polyol phosphate transport system ATPase subunit